MLRRLLLPAALFVPTPLHSAGTVSWPDTPAARQEAHALVQRLHTELLTSRSATQSLENWCRERRLADEPKIVARVIEGADKPATAEQRRRLEVPSGEELKYRRVELRCGERVLSVADNWYVPSRLTPGMNRQLETTGTPFGAVVRPLEPYRRTILDRMTWSPLYDAPGSVPGALAIPEALFEQRAVLYTREHRPFSEVHEVYQGQLLAPPARW